MKRFVLTSARGGQDDRQSGPFQNGMVTIMNTGSAKLAPIDIATVEEIASYVRSVATTLDEGLLDLGFPLNPLLGGPSLVYAR